MTNKIQSAFSHIHADSSLINDTAAYLRDELSKRRRGKTVFYRLTAAFASLAALIVCFFAYNLYYKADAYVSVDVNPSVELTINQFNMVIGTYAFNEEGTELLSPLKLRGKSCGSAIELLFTAMQSKGYLTENALVSMTVRAESGDKEQTIYSDLQNYLDERFLPGNTAVETEVAVVTYEVWGCAHSLGMSPAKYLAIQELMEVDEGATMEVYGNASIAQIKTRARECRDSHGTEPSESSEPFRQNGHGHGHRGGR